MIRYLQTDLTATLRVNRAKWAMICIGSAIHTGSQKPRMFANPPGKQAS